MVTNRSIKETINSVKLLNPSRLRRIIEEDSFPKGLLTNMGMYKPVFPLQHLVKCWELILKTDDFTESFMPHVLKARKRVEEIEALLSENYGIDFNSIDIQFHEFEDGVFYKRAWGDYTLYDIIDCDNQEQYKNLLHNCRTIDLELIWAIAKMNHHKVQQLLERGANPNARLHICSPDRVNYYNELMDKIVNEEDDDVAPVDYNYIDMVKTPISEMADEGSFLLCQLNWIIKDSEPRVFQSDAIDDIIGLAAYTEMWRILDEYSPSADSEI